MIIPKKLKIAGHIYEIVVRDREDKDGTTSLGTTDNAKGKMWINRRGCKRSQMESTVVHEIVESINFLYELELPHTKISTLETAIYQVFSDNKMFK